MKGLLHSKRFRKNLQKWLFMYVGVIFLLTTVITYSKFIAQQAANDSARTSKFYVAINQKKCSDYINDNGITCDAFSGTSCRPTQVVTSCFEIDATNLEVDSDLYLTFDPALKDSGRDDGFYSPIMKKITSSDILINIEGIDIISSGVNNEIYPNDSNGWTEGIDIADETNNNDTNDSLRIGLVKRVNSTNYTNNKWIIRVRMKKNNDSKSFPNQLKSTKLVKVGYSMIQVVE